MESIPEESFGIIPLRKSDDGWQVLIILHKHGDHWGFPKGKPDEGENSKETSSRELHEETGLTVEKYLSEGPISEKYSFIRRGVKVEKSVHYFPAIVSGALLLQPEEIRDGKWLPINEVKKHLTFEEARRVCAQVEKILKVYDL